MSEIPHFEFAVEDVFHLSSGIQVLVGQISEEIDLVRPCRAELRLDGKPVREIAILGEQFVYPNAPPGIRSLETQDLEDFDRSLLQAGQLVLVHDSNTSDCGRPTVS